MLVTRRFLAVAGLLLLTATASAIPRSEKAEVRAVADRTSYETGSSALIATVLEIEEGWHTNSNSPTYDYLIPTTVEIAVPEGWPEATVTYPPGEMETFTFAEEPLSVYQGDTVIEAAVEIPAGTDAGSRDLVVSVTYQACNDTQCLPPVTVERTVGLGVGEMGSPTDDPVFSGAGRELGGETGVGDTGAMALAGMVLLGLLGGLILNAMPCVLPVLSIKVFSLVKSAGAGRREVAVSGLATAAGIVASFLGLAGAAIAARAAGKAVGWGVQFQEPSFVAFLAVVVVLFSLNMWGVFEIELPGSLANLAGTGPSESLGGHFVTGLFATLMATPCSAPFLGAAVGFALAQPSSIILVVFTAVGIGMALPYLALAAWPEAARFLPKPGAWMVRLKEAMGFLLAGAAVWLFYVLASQVSSERLAALELALLVLALVVWLGSRTDRAVLRRVAHVATLAVALGTVAVAATAPESRSAFLEADGGAGLVPWVPFDRAEAQRLAAEGTPVFVDVTADWCFTCKVNERFVLDTPEIAGALEERGVVPMRADWTNRDDRIGDFLAEHGRYGIPFYLLYRPGDEPLVFPELLTKERVLAALRELPVPPKEAK